MPDVIVETDFHQWTLDTAEAIRERRFASIDWARVEEEIRSLGKAEQNELRSRLSQLMYHLLKIEHQPERRTASWDMTVREQQRSIMRLLQEQPSLKSRLADPSFWLDAYGNAKALSGPENLPTHVVEQFPEDCPFGNQILES